MCGIAGLFAGQAQSREALLGWVGAMSLAQKHRGPDDADAWCDPTSRVALGFRRLAILDLSEQGRQPMHSRSGRFTIVFNGEIYNHASLREELLGRGHTFRGHSDTEYMLAGFETWGIEGTLQRLVGMFGMAIWDREQEALTLVRDRLGKKPLYIGRFQHVITFASELRALLAGPLDSRKLDAAAVAQYLVRRYVPAPLSLLEGVVKLRPGHLLTLTDPHQLPESRPYWSLVDVARRGREAPFRGDDAEAVEAADALIRDAVALRMFADVPVGALLSGGIDSSLTVAMMQEVTREKVRTYTVGFDRQEHDETDHAAAIAAHVGTEHRAIRLDSAEVLALAPDMARLFDEPIANASQLPTYLVSRLAREEVTVALTGDGGDEVFAGYNRYIHGRRLMGTLLGMPGWARRASGAFLRTVPAALYEAVGHLPGAPRLLSEKAEKLAAMASADSPSSMYATLLATGPEAWRLSRNGGVEINLPSMQGAGDPVLGAMQLEDQQHYLPDDLLAKVDRASMAVSLEVRNPFLDHRVVEFAWSLPDRFRIRNGEGKWMLRALLSKRIPETLWNRPKVGFTVPLAAWLRGPLEGTVDGVLQDPRWNAAQSFDIHGAREVWARFRAGKSGEAALIWAVVMLLSWCDAYDVVP